jgi:uncharacterized protein
MPAPSRTMATGEGRASSFETRSFGPLLRTRIKDLMVRRRGLRPRRLEPWPYNRLFPGRSLARSALHRPRPLPHINPMPEDAPTARLPRCPICGKPTVAQFRPFCSRRCADIDLNRWLSGVYAVPGKPEETEDEAPAAKPEDDGE